MRPPTRLLAAAMVFGLATPAALTAQASSSTASTRKAQLTPVSVRWNRLVPVLIDEATASRRAARAAAKAAGDSALLRKIAQTPAPFSFNIYTLLSIAQYAAANSAQANHDISSDAAVAAASATVLRELFNDSSVRVSIARELAQDVERAGARSRGAQATQRAKELGEDVAHRVMVWAPKFNLVAPWNGTIPSGPGMWYSAPGIPPIGVTVGTSRTYLLDSAAQFRPGPPPTFGSPEWQAAIAEVRRVGQTRTKEQTEIAQRWNSGDPSTIWNEKASDAIRRHRMSDVDAARVLAVLNAAGLDAAVACFDAKYHYWTIRPSQADTTIVLADSVGLPNFPSYPSGHACTAGAFDAVLGHFFPDERAEFTRTAEEQAMSRLYGGIHYRFDNDGGLKLGRIVARYAIDQERHGRLNLWKTAAVAGKP